MTGAGSGASLVRVKARWVLALAVLVAGCSSGSSGNAGASGNGGNGGSGGNGGGSSGGSGGSGGGTATSCSTAATFTGDGTYYNADGSGNCSFDASPNDLMVAAMNDPDYAGSALCGACATVTGPKGQVTVRIVDRCPECKHGDLDLSPQAFGKIADMSAGRVSISWQLVACDVTGPIQYKFKEGSNQWWSAVQIRNHRYAIDKLEFKDDSGKYVSVARESYNYFVQSSGMGPGPYTFRVTDVFGHTLEDTGIAFVEGGVKDGKAQFPACAP